MKTTDYNDEPLPYPTIKHRTRWADCPCSEEYLVPIEDKPKVFEQLYPYARMPDLDTTVMDMHEEKEFVIREFKVVREAGMNLLVSPYYYHSGGSVIDWMPLEEPDDDEEDLNVPGGTYDLTGLFGGSMIAQLVKPGCEARLTGLIHRQHEGRGL